MIQFFLFLCICLGLIPVSSYAERPEKYMQHAQQLNLVQHPTWQRLMYIEHEKHQVKSIGFFQTQNVNSSLLAELNANIEALFQSSDVDQSVHCRFPARSQWLIQQLNIPVHEIPNIKCEKFDKWWAEIQPKHVTLIYATDFMGNPSSMFGHTLLRIDPKIDAELSLVSYAVNYAAQVADQDSWSFAWKGLTGQYAGTYSILPYYRKVKEYGDFESRDLWEYQLNLTTVETEFLVKHLWEMKNVTFPYYFISDNCAYRLLGLLDLVRPDLNLQAKFKKTTVPIDTLKEMQQDGLVEKVIYRPALETQLNAQTRLHGKHLASIAQSLIHNDLSDISQLLIGYSIENKAKILEMAYDALYLQLMQRKVNPQEAQPKLLQFLDYRSQLEVEKQRQSPIVPQFDPSQSHPTRQIGISMGQVQDHHILELNYRQAYHDLIDPQAGFRLGSQLKVFEGNLQYREERLKLNELTVLAVNSYIPVTPFKVDLSWGGSVGWQQEALGSQGEFSEQQQHGVVSLKTQWGYSWLFGEKQQHLCYGQVQHQFQAAKVLNLGWRLGMGPTLGCQNQWATNMNSIVQIEFPFWHDSEQWYLKWNTQLQYVVHQDKAIRMGYEYQHQDGKDSQWMKMSYVQFY